MPWHLVNLVDHAIMLLVEKLNASGSVMRVRSWKLNIPTFPD